MLQLQLVHLLIKGISHAHIRTHWAMGRNRPTFSNLVTCPCTRCPGTHLCSTLHVSSSQSELWRHEVYQLSATFSMWLANAGASPTCTFSGCATRLHLLRPSPVAKHRCSLQICPAQLSPILSFKAQLQAIFKGGQEWSIEGEHAKLIYIFKTCSAACGAKRTCR